MNFQKFVFCALVRVRIGMVFTSKLKVFVSLTAFTMTADDYGLTEKYTFLISAAVASLFTPSTAYGSLGAQLAGVGWNSR